MYEGEEEEEKGEQTECVGNIAILSMSSRILPSLFISPVFNVIFDDIFMPSFRPPYPPNLPQYCYHFRILFPCIFYRKLTSTILLPCALCFRYLLILLPLFISDIPVIFL